MTDIATVNGNLVIIQKNISVEALCAKLEPLKTKVKQLSNTLNEVNRKVEELNQTSDDQQTNKELYAAIKKKKVTSR